MKTTFLFLGIIISTGLFAQSSDNPYDNQYDERDGLRRVEYRGKYGYIDAKGDEVITLQYAAAADFTDGLAKVSLDKKKYGYINTKGAVVVPLEYEELFYGFVNGYTPAKKNGRWGMIDARGRQVIAFNYDYVYYPSEDLVLAGKKAGDDFVYGYLNLQDKEVIPFKYSYAGSFSEGLASVKLGAKYGFINTKGEAVVAMQFENSFSFFEGLAGVKQNGKWGFINKTGNMVIRPEYNRVRSFKGGEAEVLKGAEGFYINKEGKRLKNGKWLLIFTKGTNMNDQYWFRGEKWADDLKKKYNEGYRYTDFEWNREEAELFVTMSKTYSYWQSNFYHSFSFDKMWEKVLEHYKEDRSVVSLSYNKGKWTFMFNQLPSGKKEVAVNSKTFPLENVKKHWGAGKYITNIACGDRWMIVMRQENYSDQIIKTYDYTWDQESVEAFYKRGYFITEVVKQGGTYLVIYTKGSPIKDQLLVWDEELPLREIKGYWNKGWQSYRAIYIPREVTIDEDIW